jgi:curved DNA-binding protein CbpA
VNSADPYVVLGVAPDATRAEIAHAYRQLVRQHHPDLRDLDAADADLSGAYLERVLRAYATLRDPQRRAGDDKPARSAATTNPDRADRAPDRIRRDERPLRAGPVFWRPAAPQQALRRWQVTHART